MEVFFDDIVVQEINVYSTLGWGFDGVDDVVDCGNGSSLDLNNDISMVAWVRCLTGTTFSRQSVICKVHTDYKGYGLRVTDNGQLGLHFIGASADKTFNRDPGYNINDFKWHFLAATVSSGTTGVLYLDGVQVSTSANISGAGSTSTVATLKIGELQTSDPVWSKFNIGDASVFNRALSAQEIRDYYENTKAIFPN
jgi:hypothetical protein